MDSRGRTATSAGATYEVQPYSAAGEPLCDKTFYAKDSKSGYGVYVLVDSLGRVLVG